MKTALDFGGVPAMGRVVIFYELREGNILLKYPAVVVSCSDDGIATLNVFTPYGCNPERNVPPCNFEATNPQDRSWRWPSRKEAP